MVIRIVGGILLAGLLLGVLLLAGLFYYGWSQSRAYALLQDTRDLAQRIERRAEGYVAKRKNVRLAVGFYQRGRRYVRSFGTTVPPDRVTPDGKEIYEIGSITKVFTGILLGEGVEQGTVELQQTLRECLPPDVSLPEQLSAITLEQLATHTSGLPRLPDHFFRVVDDQDNPYRSYTTEHLYQGLSEAKLRRPPGKKSDYSNLGFGLLGHVLSSRAGMAYEQLVEREVCRPLGLTDTRVALSDEQAQRLVPGYTSDGQPAVNWDFDVMAPAGALRSTVDDLLRFIEANLGRAEGPLNKSLQVAQKKHHQDWTGSVGLGWQIMEDPFTELTIHWHNGGTGGYCSFLGFIQSKEVGVVLLSNYGDAMAGDDSLDTMGMELLKWGSKISL